MAPGEFVFAEHGEEFDVAELTGLGLGEPGFERVEHPEES